MAWVYPNWITEATDSARLTALRSHIAEVSADLETHRTSVSSDGKAMTREQRIEYLRWLTSERDRLEGKMSTSATAGGRSHIRLGRA